MKRVIITHAEHGVFVGISMNLAFFSLMDCVGQSTVPTFPTKEDASAFLDSLDIGWERDGFHFFEGEVSGDYAEAVELLQAGVPQRMVEPIIQNEIIKVRARAAAGMRFQ